MLSTASVLGTQHATTTYETASHTIPAPHTMTPHTSVTYNPSQIASAYGFNKLSNDGTGQTIAIVDAYHYPTVVSDLHLFDTTFGLPDPPSLTVMSQTGSTTSLPGTDPTKGWETESALDVQWAHALAPGAKIVLVEANSASDADLFTAVQTAAALPGVSVVSMSWGGGEFSSEAAFDSVFTTPGGHQGVTFLASTGDNGAPGGFPAYSSKVVAVGGTSLTIDGSGNYVSESAWSGSGGGISLYESQPSYQTGIVTQTTTKRAIPDVSFDADPNTGVYVVNSFTNGTANPWMALGGTSYSAPAWAAIMAIVNEGRVQNGLTTLDGFSQTLPMLYQLSQTNPSAFHDIKTGNNGFAATTGYDLVTGLGSPVVDVLVPAMSGGTSSGGGGGGGGTTSNTQLIIQRSPASGTAGVALTSIPVAVQDSTGKILKTNTSMVTLTLSSGTFGNGSSTATATVSNGIATFNGLIINTAGTYTVTASDGSMTTASFDITINPAAAKTPVWQTAPQSTATAGATLNAIVVAAQDAFGNQVSATATVMLKITGGKFANGSTIMTATTSGGLATFGNVAINAAGSYSLTASIGTANTSSASITVSPAAAYKLVWQTAPSTSAVAGTTMNSIVVLVEDAYGNIVTTDHSTVTLTINNGAFGNGSSTMTATASNGVATFSTVSIKATGIYQITASDSASLNNVTSSNITITPADMASLAFQQNPTSGTAGVSLMPSVKVQVLDQYGNLVKATTTVTLTLGSGTFSNGSNSITANSVNGVATFGAMILTSAGTFTLTASAGTLTGPSFQVTINPNVARTPVWQTAPASSVVAGVALGSIVVAANDAYGNLVSNPANVTLRLVGGKFADGTTSMTVATTNGLATFSGLTINVAGSYTLTAYVGSAATTGSTLTVTPAAANKLVWKTAPSSKAVAGTTLNAAVVAVQDTFGNVVTSDHSSVKVTLSSGTFAGGSATATVTAINGLATFSSLAINITGTYQLTASDGSLTTVTSGNVAITPSTLASLSFQQNPTTAIAGVAFSPAVKVAALDQYGNLVTTSTQVTLTLTGGTFSNKGTSVVSSTVSGVASFNSLVINVAGNYSLAATASGLTGPSFNVTVSPNDPKKLVWQNAPTSAAIAGTTLSTMSALVEDAYGNVVTTDTSSVTLTLSSKTFADGSQTETVSAVNGVATFTGLAINSAGTFHITATDSATLTPASSGNVVISPGSLSNLVVTQSPATATAGVAMGLIKVQALDQYGNLIMTSTNVTLTLTGATFAAGSATTTASTTSGIASFTGLIINSAGTFSLKASVSSVSSSTVSVTVNPAAAKTPVWQTVPDTTGTAGTALHDIVVIAQDAFGNQVSSSAIVTLKITGGKFSNGSTMMTVNASGGVATFSNVTINLAGTFQLTAGIGVATTSSPNITISAAAASKLGWQTAPPTSGIAGSNLTSFVVALQDAYGNVVTTDNSTVTLTISTGTFSGGATTVTATAVNGLATFSSVAIAAFGNYRLTASNSNNLTTVTSSNISIAKSS